MNDKREIDERDIDKLLLALSDVQLAKLFDMTVTEVSKLRQSRKSLPTQADPTSNMNSGLKP